MFNKLKTWWQLRKIQRTIAQTDRELDLLNEQINKQEQQNTKLEQVLKRNTQTMAELSKYLTQTEDN